MPTVPSHQAWPAAHSTVSRPSAASSANGRKTPSDAYRPRTSCTTRQYPASTSRIQSRERPPADAPLPYGVRRRRAGSGREVSGRYTSARSTTPSLMDTGTFRSITSRTGVSSQPAERV